ncbi:lysophospholipase [Mycena polygramma]|nr:lysophospholipase [Mycena polygramma]
MKYSISSLLIIGSFSSVVSQLPPFSKTSLAAYTPHLSTCPPNFSLIREAGSPGGQSLSAGEQAYVDARRDHVLPDAFRSYVDNLISTGQDIPPTLKSIFYGERGASPSYGLAVSGGALRAALFAAGALNVFDGRNKTSNFAGLGGILQGAEYLSGLSGGGWLVVAFAQADMPTIPDLIFGRPDAKDDEYGGFNLAFDILSPFTNKTQDQAFITGLILDTGGKAAAGNPVTVSDGFGISLARHFANGTNAANLLDFDTAVHGTGQLFSDIAKVPSFQAHTLPFPIVISTLNSNRGNGTFSDRGLVPLSTTKFEYNIFEFGSYDPNLSAFIPMQNMGTVNESSCVVGFDQIAFVLGSTGGVFPSVNASEPPFTPDSALGQEFKAVTGAFSQLIPSNPPDIRLDSALVPNPFAGRHGFTEEKEEFLTVADGGLDGSNVAFQPLLVKARGVQAIIAIDVSDDTLNSFTNGSAIIAEAERVALLPGAYKFPQIPKTEAEFLAQNLTTQPTFFGCDEGQDVPLILYFANGAPPPGKLPVTNASTGQLSFPDLGLVQEILDQAGEIVSRGRPQNGEARDGLFPVCVACALADRERSRLGMKRDQQCDVCFDRYCYKPGEGQQSAFAAASGALADAVSGSSDSVTKYGPIVIGLLGANLLVSAVLAVLGVVLCVRKRGTPARYTPLDS